MSMCASPKDALASRRAAARGDVELRGFTHDAHAFAAAAGRRLEQYRVSDAIGLGAQQVVRLIVAVVAGYDRYAGILDQGLGGALGAHGAYGRRARPDEDQARSAAVCGESGIFGEEPVTGMNGRGAGPQRRRDDAVPAQVAVPRRRRTNLHRFVGEGDMPGRRIRFRMDGYRGDAQTPRGLDHAAGDLAAVGNQDLREHGPAAHMRNTPNRVSSMGAFRAAEMPRPSTMRVSRGSMTPSSHSRAVA